jgi:1,4-alpha-glucan branching enzyme
MGCEFGQIQEWHYEKPINFMLLKAEKNKKLQKFIANLNKLYLNTPEMYEIDFDPCGFEWLVKNDNNNCVVAFKIYSKSRNYLICICNFSPYPQDDYVLGVDEPGCYSEIFSSNDEAFGGNGMKNDVMYSSIMNKNGKTNVIRVDLPANSALIIRKD